MINQSILQHKNEVTDGKKIWYIAELLGFVMELDIETMRLKCLLKIPSFFQPVDYRGICYSGEELYVLPHNTDVLYIYNVNDKSLQSIKLMGRYQLMGGIERDGELYLYGCTSVVVKIQVQSKHIDYIGIDKDKLKIDVDSNAWFWTDSFARDNSIFLPIQNANLIIKIDKADKVSCVCLGQKQENWLCRNIGRKKDRYYAVHLEGEKDKTHIISKSFDLQGKLVGSKEYKIYGDCVSYQFVYASLTDYGWYILPYGMHGIYWSCFDRDNAEKIYEPKEELNVSSKTNGDFLCAINCEENLICAINQVLGKYVEIDITKNSVCEHKLYFDKASSQEALKERILDGTIVREAEGVIELSDLVETIL